MSAQPTLSAPHAALIAASGISDAVRDARGYQTVYTRAGLRRLGFTDVQQRTPALLLPVHDVTGTVALYQARPDQPRIKDGRPIKYETPGGARMALDVPPAIRPQLGDPRVPLICTEGIRKADAAASVGLCCVALLGVWNWRGRNEHGGKVALPDFEHIALNDRAVYIAYDSDVMLKREVLAACERLAALLTQRGAQVRYILLPAMPDGAKQGLDDYLAAGHTPADLFALARAEVPRLDAEATGQAGHAYRATLAGLVYDRPTRDGAITTPLTNFNARIVADVLEDDGAETRRSFAMEATIGGRTSRFALPAVQFAGMNWPTEQLGARAIVFPGFGARDHARAAIQLLSGEPTTRHVYAHTGWREIDGARCYLHAGGAIGAAGARSDITVALPAGLTGYALPDPPDGAALHDAIRASLDVLTVAPARVTYPLMAAVYRAVCGPVDLSVHLSGPTGAGKSELAALQQQHFGAALSARNLPGSWDSTANALEALAFAAKDALFVVDDFMPNARGADAVRLHRDADRLLRAVGNQAGRQRMRADTTLRPAKPPRALIVSTGEDSPRGQSLRARMLILDLAPGELDWGALTACQSNAAAGVYAAALAGYLRWLAASYPETAGAPALIREDVSRLRTLAADAQQHRRTPDVIAQLAVGLRLFLDYARDVGALSAHEADTHAAAAWAALGAAAQSQAAQQAAGEPAGRFIDLLAAALGSGRAHVAAPSGDAPEQPHAWGWRAATVGTGEHQRTEWRPAGERVGWRDGDALYLDRDAALSVARRLAADGGEPVTIGRDTLTKRLDERGFLVGTEQQHGELTVRRMLEGQRRRVWHIAAGTVYPQHESGQSGHAPASDIEWPDSVPDWPTATTESGQPSGQRFADAGAETDGIGRIGRIPETTDSTHAPDARDPRDAGRIPNPTPENPASHPASHPANVTACPRCGYGGLRRRYDGALVCQRPICAYVMESGAA